MSEFSRKLKETIKSHNTNVYQISRKTGLDHTTLQKMVNGKRLSGKEYLEQLLEHLQLSQEERNELQLLYEIERMGTHTYYARQKIQKLFYGIPQDVGQLVEEHGEEDTILETPKMLCGRKQILSGIRSCIRQEFQKSQMVDIYLNWNDDLSELFQMISSEEQKSNNEVHIFQLLCLDRRAEGIVQNLELLYAVVEIAVKKGKDYQSFYTYSSQSEQDKDMQMWSDCMVIGKNVVLLSKKAETALVIADLEFAKACVAQLKEMIAYSSPFLTCLKKTEPDAAELLYSNGIIKVSRQENGALVLQYENQMDETAIRIEEQGIITAIMEYCEQFADSVEQEMKMDIRDI